MSEIINLGSIASAPSYFRTSDARVSFGSAAFEVARNVQAVESKAETQRVAVSMEAAGDFKPESRFRQAVLNSIRVQIEAGTYETNERIAGTVERLIDVIA